MYARGLRTRQISDTIEELYGFEVSDSFVSDVTDKILPQIHVISATIFSERKILILTASLPQTIWTSMLFQTSEEEKISVTMILLMTIILLTVWKSFLCKSTIWKISSKTASATRNFIKFLKPLFSLNLLLVNGETFASSKNWIKDWQHH